MYGVFGLRMGGAKERRVGRVRGLRDSLNGK